MAKLMINANEVARGAVFVTVDRPSIELILIHDSPPHSVLPGKKQLNSQQDPQKPISYSITKCRHADKEQNLYPLRVLLSAFFRGPKCIG